MAEEMIPMPSVGRIVHYRDEGSCIAAIITEVVVTEDAVRKPTTFISLCTFFPDDSRYSPRRFMVPQGLTDKTWHWPERV